MKLDKNSDMEEQKLINILSAKNYDLAIVTTRLNDKINGQTVAWSTQASIKPPMITIGLAEERYTSSLVKKSKVFALNFIPRDRQVLIEKFGYQTGRDVDKFKDVEFKTAITGSPILRESISYLDCKVIDIFKTGDHEIFVGEVVGAGYESTDWFQTRDLKTKAA